MVKVRLKIGAREGAAGDEVEVSESRAQALVRGNAATRLDTDATPESGRAGGRSAAPGDRRATLSTGMRVNRAQLEAMTLDDLRAEAGKAEVEGRSSMDKAQLIGALLERG